MITGPMNEDLRNMLMRLDVGRENDIRAEIADIRDVVRSLWALYSGQAIQPGVDDNGTSRTTAGGIVLEQTINKANAQWIDWWLPLTLADDDVTYIYCQVLRIIGGVKYLYVGGRFSRIGGVAAKNVARYNYASRSWEAVGDSMEGTSNEVYCIAFDAADTIYIGGNFANAGGDALADNVAKLSGGSWVNVGGSLNSTVSAIAFNSAGDLYIGGDFTNAGGDALADNVAKLSGGSWVNVGGALNGTVRSIAFNSAGDLYIGGEFTNAGGDALADRVAKLSGGSWVNVGGGVNATVYAVLFDAADILYIGGVFTDAGGDASADMIARLLDGVWVNVGGGVNNAVRAIAANNGQIYIGGNFTDAGGIAEADRIACFDGVSWNALTNGGGLSGLDGYLYSVVVDPVNNTVYAGGSFNVAGTIQCKCIACFCRPLADALDIVAGLFEQYQARADDVYAPIAHVGDTSNPHNVTAAQVGALGYTLQVSCLPQPTTIDGQTVYWGNLPVVPNTNTGYARIYIPKAGKIKAAYVFVRANTAGSGENWSMYIRVNSTTDYLIETEASSGAVRNFINTSLNSGNYISVSAGDYIEIKEVHPTWATNPADVLRSGVIYIEPA